MNKYISPVAAGGAPLNNERFITELGLEFWDSIEGILKGIQDRWSGNNPNGAFGIILSGCEVIGGPTFYGQNPGIVYLNGVVLRHPGFVQTGSQLVAASTYWIQRSTDVNIPKTFGDGVSRNLIVNQNAFTTGSAPGTGHFIPFVPNAGSIPYRLPDAILNSGVQTAINASTAAEAVLRGNADTTLQTNINTVQTNVNNLGFTIYTFTTLSAGALETVTTLARTANKTTRYSIEMVATRVSGADAAGSYASRYISVPVKDLAGTGTAGTTTAIEANTSTAGAPALTVAVSGTNTLIQVQPGSSTSYLCYIIVKIMVA